MRNPKLVTATTTRDSLPFPGPVVDASGRLPDVPAECPSWTSSASKAPSSLRCVRFRNLTSESSMLPEQLMHGGQRMGQRRRFDAFPARG